jgi:hypothetical protein
VRPLVIVAAQVHHDEKPAAAHEPACVVKHARGRREVVHDHRGDYEPVARNVRQRREVPIQQPHVRLFCRDRSAALEHGGLVVDRHDACEPRREQAQQLTVAGADLERGELGLLGSLGRNFAIDELQHARHVDGRVADAGLLQGEVRRVRREECAAPAVALGMDLLDLPELVAR